MVLIPHFDRPMLSVIARITHLRGVLLILCIAFGTGVSMPSPAQVTSQFVEVTGEGTNIDEAVNHALLSAIQQVNGAEIAAQVKTSLVSKLASDRGQTEQSLSKSFAETIGKKTQGYINGFEVLNSERESAKNPARVKLRVEVSRYIQSIQTKRLRLAIVPFRLNSDIKDLSSAKKYEEIFRNELENNLTQSRRFAMLDRTFLAQQNNEINFLLGAIGSENAPNSTKRGELARIGNRLGADYIVTGVVSSAALTSETVTFKNTGKKIKSTKSNGNFLVRIIDVSSGQVKFAFSVKNSKPGGTISDLMEFLAQVSAQKIINAIYPIAVLAVDGKIVTVGQGGDGLRIGDVYSLVRLGEELIDPYTQEPLGRRETTIGRTRIVDVQAKTATALVVQVNTKDGDIGAGEYILRPFNNDPTTSVGSSSKTVSPSQKFDADFDREFGKF